MLLLCYPGCTTCRRAQRWLDSAGVAYELRDIKRHNPTADELRVWQAASGLPPRRFFNTSGERYRALGLKDKLPAMSDEQQLALLATDGMLVKRPILVAADTVLVGFREEEWRSRLL